MSDQIELHDSRVAIDRQAGTIVLRLSPAYVHHWEWLDGRWIGEGRRQAAEIVLAGGILDSVADEPSDVSDGWLEVDGQRYENMLPVPLTKAGAARGRLELVGAPPMTFSAEEVAIRLVGEPAFVEALPPEWAPQGGAGSQGIAADGRVGRCASSPARR